MRRNSLRAVDANLFKVFAAIYSQRNLTRAGEILAMTQPSVSRALDRLRAVFNDRLFYRVDGEMRPTRTAELVAPQILEGLARLESALDTKIDDSPANQAVTVRLGINDYLSAVVLPLVVAQLRAHWPNAFLLTVYSTYQSAPRQVLREEVDCAIVSSLAFNERVASQALFDEDYVAVSGRDHPLAGEPLTLQSYLAFPHVLVSYTGVRAGWVDQKLESLGHSRCIGAAVHLYAGTPQLLSSHPYFCTMPRRLAMQLARAHDLSVHELPFESARHVFHLVWARHLTPNPVASCVREHIVAACRALAPPAAAPAQDTVAAS